ncbi:IPT/TIG domain-containing protein [candidate division KSB1 bacterium]|nr:IPT/TIG domain-containing protein [candidate division KSB1 bacterium]
MKLLKCMLFVSALFALLICPGCKMDEPTALYKQKYTSAEAPVITEITPVAGAPAGVNYISLKGKNFSPDISKTQVYVDGYTAELTHLDSVSITFRRPDRTGDSTSIKVNVFGAAALGVLEPYKIDPVYEPFGKFISGDRIGGIAVDKSENLYVVENNTAHTVYKIDPQGNKTVAGHTDGNINGATIGPDGNLYVFIRKREIYMLDLAAGVDTLALWTSVGANMTRGCFDDFGNLYTSGAKRSDVVVVTPDLSNRSLGLYPNDEIFCMQVYENYLYLLVEVASPNESKPALAIWRHAILDASGNLGDRDLLLDWSTTEEYAESAPLTFAVGNDGNIYIGTDYTYPIMFYNHQDGSMDMVYKAILPTSAEMLAWGTGNYMYMVLGGEAWNVLRLSMGVPEVRDFGKSR